MPLISQPGQEAGPVRQDALPGRPWEKRRPALQTLFEEISPRYDLLNRFLSFGLDRSWRAWAVAELGSRTGGVVLDLASGTGELALHLRGQGEGMVLRSDLSPALLERGRAKWPQGKPGAGSERPSPGLACEMDRLPLRSGSLDAVVQGFALRHCRAADSLFGEIYRVLAPGGRLSILDMRYPRSGISSAFYRFYFREVLPWLAGLLGGDRAAYRFMVDSVRSLPPEEELLEGLRRAGFTEVVSRPGVFGAVRLLTGLRP